MPSKNGKRAYSKKVVNKDAAKVRSCLKCRKLGPHWICPECQHLNKGVSGIREMRVIASSGKSADEY
jgi:hypothetical protein